MLFRSVVEEDELMEDESGLFTPAQMSILRRAQAKLAAGEELTEEEKNLLSESTSASTSLSTQHSAMASESESISESLSTESSETVSVSISLSASTSEHLAVSQSASESLHTSMSAALSEAQSEYDSLLEHYNDGEQRLERLEELKKLIDAQSEVVERFRAMDEAHWSHKLGTTKSADGQTYWEAADQLANLLIKYKMLSDAQVNNYTDVNFSNDGNWIEYEKGTDVDGRYIEVSYKDQNGNEQTRYFDYATADKDGNAIANRNETTTYWSFPNYNKTANRDDATKVKYIYIVEMKKSHDGKFIVSKNDGYKGGKGYFSQKDFIDGRDDYQNEYRSEYVEKSESLRLKESESASQSNSLLAESEAASMEAITISLLGEKLLAVINSMERE